MAMLFRDQLIDCRVQSLTLVQFRKKIALRNFKELRKVQQLVIRDDYQLRLDFSDVATGDSPSCPA